MARKDPYWSHDVMPVEINDSGIKSIPIHLTLEKKGSGEPMSGKTVQYSIDGIPGESRVTDVNGKVSFVITCAGNEKSEVVFTTDKGRRKILLDFSTDALAAESPITPIPETSTTNPLFEVRENSETESWDFPPVQANDAEQDLPSFLREEKISFSLYREQEKNQAKSKIEHFFQLRYGRWIFAASMLVATVTILAIIYESGLIR